MIQKDFIFRKAGTSDTADIASLTKLAYNDFVNILTPSNWDKMSTSLSNENMFSELQNKATSFVCVVNNLLVGSIFLIPRGNPTNVFPNEWSYIRLLGVHPNYRGLGIGKKLTNLCVRHAIDEGENTIALHTILTS